MSGSEAAIVFSAAALSVAGVAFAVLAASMARRVTDIVGMAGGVIILTSRRLPPRAGGRRGGGKPSTHIPLCRRGRPASSLKSSFAPAPDPAPATVGLARGSAFWCWQSTPRLTAPSTTPSSDMEMVMGCSPR